MTTKNFPASGGYLDPENRGWETVVTGAGKPLLSAELNLAQDIDAGAGQAALKRLMPSGWISDDFTNSSSSTSAIFTAVATANKVRVPNNLVAHVNGWLLNIKHSGANGSNDLTLTASPSGAGVRRTDVVVLEVWRRLLDPSPSTVGKSPSGRIWQFGNVKTFATDDLTLNYADDILDANIGTETTKRVQIQYRLRVVPSIDIFTYPYALDDPSLVAYTVPASAAAPDGTATLHTYSNQETNGDCGLWRAGDGNPANTLGTVDGYMYAIPLMAVFRRNSTAWNRLTNQNGGVATPGPSDRPDGLFFDVVDARDVVDLRLGVSPTGWSFPEILDKNVNYLFDNTLKTEWMLNQKGGGSHGHTVLWADEIGITNAHGGDSVNTGTTAAASLIGEFDGVRRSFSDRATFEILTVKITVPGGGWASATPTINFTSVAVNPYTAYNWAAYSSNAIVVDLVSATFIGTSGNKTFNAITHIKKVTGLGEIPVGNLSLTMSTLSGLGITNEDLYVDLLVCYPPGQGLSYTPTNSYGAASFSINNAGALPAGAPILYSALANTSVENVHREANLEYTTSNITLTIAADTVVSAKSTIRMPERVNTVVSVSKNASPIVGSVTISTDRRTLSFTNAADYTDPGNNLTIVYTALRPLPQNGEQIAVWYETRAPQTSRDALIGTSLTLVPRYIPSNLYVILAGSGSLDEGYPFPNAYTQAGGTYPSSVGTFAGDQELTGRATQSISDFGAGTGFLKLSTVIPLVSNPESMTFLRSSPGDTDAEGRTFFKSIPGSTYVHNAFGQDLSDPIKHKVVFPFIAELPTTSSLGKRGQMVLVLLTRWATFDQINGVFFNADLTLNTTAASVFRLKGNLLNKRAV
jgi:hypothetical protein